MLERGIYTMFAGTDGKNYAFVNDYLVAMDKNMIVMEEAKNTRFYKLYEDKDGGVYTEEILNVYDIDITLPDESVVRLVYDMDNEIYKGGDGNSYVLEDEKIEILDKDNKSLNSLDIIGTYEEYENAKGEVYTLVYGDDGMTVVISGSETVKLSEIMG